MARNAILVELGTSDIVWLAWAAGVASGQENADATESLNGILQRLQFVELPDEETEGELIQFPEGDNTNDDLNEVREPDPQFMPPPAYIPQNRQEDFGAGPPKK